MKTVSRRACCCPSCFSGQEAEQRTHKTSVNATRRLRFLFGITHFQGQGSRPQAAARSCFNCATLGFKVQGFRLESTASKSKSVSFSPQVWSIRNPANISQSEEAGSARCAFGVGSGGGISLYWQQLMLAGSRFRGWETGRQALVRTASASGMCRPTKIIITPLWRSPKISPLTSGTESAYKSCMRRFRRFVFSAKSD